MLHTSNLSQPSNREFCGGVDGNEREIFHGIGITTERRVRISIHCKPAIEQAPGFAT